MPDGEDAGPSVSRPTSRPVRRTLNETVTVDLSGLDQDQVQELRSRLREMAAGIRDAREFPGPDVVSSHSSHNDDDGWI